LTLLIGCGASIDCGPMSKDACLHEVQQIQAVIDQNFGGGRIVSIMIVSEQGDATVKLEDGTEIGWGIRQSGTHR
jgi:hypothetical protein